MRTEHCTIRAYRMSLTLERRKAKRVLREHCDDTKFPGAGYTCSNFINNNISIDDLGYTLLYIAMDGSSVVGCISLRHLVNSSNMVDALLVTLTATITPKNPEYKGLGTRMMQRIIDDAYSDKRIQFISIYGSTPAGLALYSKMGFKQIGSTGNLVRPIRELPSIARLRYAEVRDTWKLYWYRIRSGKVSERRAYSLARSQTRRTDKLHSAWYSELPTESSYPFFTYSKTEHVPEYPAWMYKYTRTSIPVHAP
jgi:hypothetical protein